jgi:hypothetical protein
MQRCNLAARKTVLAALISAVLLTGCTDATDPKVLPPDPEIPLVPIEPNAPVYGSIAGFVIDESDDCIIGARVELIGGLQPGPVFVQTVCGFWDYGADLGFSFHNLPNGTAFTIRATAPGYELAERIAAPSNPYSYTTMIVLRKER